MITSDINGAGESVSDNAIGAHCDKFSPKPILIDQHKADCDTIEYKNLYH